MSKTDKTGFHTLRARSEDKLPDLLEVRNRLDAKTDGIHFIKEVIDRLWWRMFIRLKQPRFEPLAGHDRFARSKLYMGFDFIAPMFGIRAKDLHIKAHLVDINEYWQHIVQLVSVYWNDESANLSRLSRTDWEKIAATLAMTEKTMPTLSEALSLAAILRWNSTQLTTNSSNEHIQLCDNFLRYCEDAFSGALQAAATRLRIAVEDSEMSSAVTELLEIRANFLLEVDLLSSQCAEKVAGSFAEITVAFDAVKVKTTSAAELLAAELTSSVLSLNWGNADKACAEISDLIHYEDLGLALDVQHYINNLRWLMSASFAAFLYTGPARLSLTRHEGAQDYKRLLEMQDELEYEFLPAGSLSTLLPLIRANEVSEVVLLTKSLSAGDLITDIRKTLRYLLPQGHMIEYMTSADLWNFGVKADDAYVLLLDAKLLIDWLVPPLIAGAFLATQDGEVLAVLESFNLFNKARAMGELDLAFCTKLTRLIDKLQPDHPPILFGHVINIYFDIIGAHGSIPPTIEELQKVTEDMYFTDSSNACSRLQKSLLHVHAQSVVEKVESDSTKNFLRGCYERSGIIITDEFCTQLGDSKIKSLVAVTLLPIPSNMAKGWEKYHDRYSRLNSIDTLAIAANKFIAKESRALVGQIKEMTFTEKNPLRNYKSPHVPKDLSGHGDIIDVLIQRRAILRWAQVCELHRDDKANGKKRTSFFLSMGYGSTNLDSYSNYFHSIGLKLENLVEPDESGFFREELSWLKSFRTRK